MAFFNNLFLGDDGLSGFVVPIYNEWREALASNIRRLRGLANLNTSPGSFFGQLVDAVAQPAHVVVQVASGAVQSTLFSRARGQTLDAVVDPITTRLPAVASTSELTLYGTPGTDVPPNSLVRVNEVSATFGTDVASGPLPAINNSDNYVIEVAPFVALDESGQTFSLDIDGTVFQRVVGAFDTAEEIRNNLVALVNAALLSQRAISGGLSPTTGNQAARIAENAGLGVFPITFTYTGGNPLALLYPASQVPSTAVETGPVAVQPVSLREIATPVPGWEGVFNIVAAVTGREQESDAELKLRHRANIRSPGASSPDAIRARCLLPVEQGGGGALSCSVEYNKNDFIDGVGNLPHSIRVVGNEGVDPQEFGQAIWDTRSAGDNMNGANAVFITDTEGKAQEVLYDEQEQIYIWIEAIVSPGEGFSTVGNPLEVIRQDIADHIEALRPGRDVNPIQLPIEVGRDGTDRGIAEYYARIGYSLTELGPPIYDKDFYPAPESSAPVASQPILARQKARGDITRVSVVTP